MSVKIIHQADGQTPEQRERFVAIRARLVEIESELSVASTNTRILASPGPRDRGRFAAFQQELAAAEKHREALRRERESLHGQLPKTGESSGQRLVIGRTLGTTILRADELDAPPTVKDDGYDYSDPHQRFAKQMGWSLD